MDSLGTLIGYIIKRDPRVESTRDASELGTRDFSAQYNTE